MFRPRTRYVTSLLSASFDSFPSFPSGSPQQPQQAQQYHDPDEEQPYRHPRQYYSHEEGAEDGEHHHQMDGQQPSPSSSSSTAAYRDPSDPFTANISGVGGKIGRERQQEQALADQFSRIDGGWQKGDNSRFDLFVEEKRRRQAFEEFDQRVQRAFGRAVRQHRAEVWNGFKRQLKRTGGRLTPDVLEKVNHAVTEREEWLRDVFTTIDADYRSNDTERHTRATRDIRTALDGRSGELLLPHYEAKLEKRFAGAKKQRLMEEEQESDIEGPNIANDEVNRYSGLKPNIAAIEDAVVSRYGRAGREHWDILQSEKDAEYAEKLGRAAEVYKGLLEQQKAYDESAGQRPVRDFVRRISRAQVRFRTALEVEATREQLVEAHEQMKRIRGEEADQRRLARHKEATEMRRTGVPTAEVRKTMQAQTLDRLNRDLASQVVAEKEEARSRKKLFTQMLDQLEFDSERQEGEAWMATSGVGDGSSSSSSSNPANYYYGNVGHLGDDADPFKQAEPRKMHSATTNLVARSQKFTDPQIKEALDDTATLVQQVRDSGRMKDVSDGALTKKALWKVLNQDKWEDPFRVIHAARVQARDTYSEVYSMTDPHKMRLGRKAHRGLNMFLRAGDEAQILQDPWVEHHALNWGLSRSAYEDIHHLDPDGTTKYVAEVGGWRVRDPETGDIDFRYEKKLGRGGRWTGPKFYKLGYDNDETIANRPAKEDPSIKRRKIPKLK